MMLALAASLLLASPPVAAEESQPVLLYVDLFDQEAFDDPVGLPDPDERRRGGRIRATKGRHSNRYRLKERRFGLALIPSYAVPQGDVVQASFDNGIGFTLRGVVGASDANSFFFDIGYSRHDMRDPKAMFFRTAVTSDSDFSGALQIWSPAIYYAYSIPIAAGRGRPLLLPRLYFGMGPMLTLANGRVTQAGSKGTVTGQGTQPFMQFTPGFLFDVRVMEHAFVGVDMKYRLTVPTSRPNQTKEFAIPKVYVFEPGVSFTYMFF